MGVDLAPRMIELATHLDPTLAFRIADVKTLPFAEGSFDAIVCNFGIGHFPRPERAVEECVRVLVGGGRLSFSWWAVPERTRLQGVFIDALHRAGAIPPPDIPTGPPLFRFSAEDEFAAVLRAAGLRHVVAQGQAFTYCVSTLRLSGQEPWGVWRAPQRPFVGKLPRCSSVSARCSIGWYVPMPERMVLHCPWPSRSPQDASPVATSGTFHAEPRSPDACVVGHYEKQESQDQSAMSAAPKAIAKNATILDYPAKEGDQPPVLRKGTNDWACFPDDPNSPGNDPMCLDKMGRILFEASTTKTEPKLTAPGLSYMRQEVATPVMQSPLPPSRQPFTGHLAPPSHDHFYSETIQPCSPLIRVLEGHGSCGVGPRMSTEWSR